jgi:hypothetical protein
MKTLNLFLIMLITSSAFFKCTTEDDLSRKDEKIEMLTRAPWVADNVSNDADGDLTFQYTNFVIAFVRNGDGSFDGDYYLSEGGHAFPEPYGKWKFSDDLDELIFSTGREMGADLSEDNLTLTFYLAPVDGRVKGLSGDFTFRLKRN